MREAQRLRYRVFGGELGARLATPEAGVDADEFDAYCEHLLVRNADAVVGTYRILPGARATELGRYYSESEFDLGRIVDLPRLVEVGRACIDPAHRNGAVLALLWSALAGLIRTRGWDYVIGCASLPVDAGGSVALLCRQVLDEHLSPPQWRAVPRRPFPLTPSPAASAAPLPTLLRGYLRMGAYVCGDPAWDPDFGTADLLVLLSMQRFHGRYARRFLRAA